MSFKKRKVSVGRARIHCRALLDTLDVERRTVQFVFTTGARVRRYDWWEGKWFLEELEVTAEAVMMGFFESGAAPFLINHNSWDVNQQVGVIQKAWLKPEDNEGIVEVRFAKDEISEKHFQRVVDGISVNASVGYVPVKYRDVTEKEDEMTVLRAIAWEPLETSLVAIPADRGQRSEDLRADDPKNPAEAPEARTEVPIVEIRVEPKTQNQPERKPTMDEEEKKRLAEEEARKRVAEEARKREEELKADAAKRATEAERQRIADIESACEAFGVERKMATEMIRRGIAVDDARKEIQEHLAKQQPQVRSKTDISVTRDEMATRREGIQGALLHRVNPSVHKLEGPAVDFRGFTLLDTCRELLEQRGEKHRGLSKSVIAIRAMTTSDLPILLGETANRSLRAAYEIAKPTFWAFCRRGILPDYREASRVQFGSFADLKLVDENGEYEESYIGEGKEKVRVRKRGRLLAVTEEAIINDDMDALGRIPVLIGNAASRAESKFVYGDIIVGNPLMSDGKNLFHADHGNLAAAPGAVNETNLTAAEKAMREQMDLGGNDYLDIVPRVLVHGTAKRVEVLKMLTAITANKAGDVNVFQGGYIPVCDPRMPGNAWFLAADPNAFDTIEVAYLEGEEGPSISTQAEFKHDRLIYKARHVFGGGPIDHRGFFMTPSA